MAITITSGPEASYHSLWNGAANDEPPDGWWRSDFDDAGWAFAGRASITGEEHLAPGSSPIWSGEDPRSSTERVLFRQHFDLPADVVSASIEISYDDALQGVYVNGSLSSVAGTSYAAPTAPEEVPISMFMAGGHNVLAIVAQNTLGGAAYISYTLTVLTTDDTGTTSGADVATAGAYGDALGTGSGGPAAVRLRHATGVLDWEHDSVLFRVRSGGKTTLQVPFPVSTQPAPAYLGHDPLTGLPMWMAPPPVVAIAPAPAAVPTPATVTPDAFRCNIAQYVTQQMNQAYGVASAKITSLNTTENTLVALGGPLAAAILGLLDIVFPPLLIVTSFAIPFLVLLANYREHATLEPLGGPALQAIAKSLYCALRPDSSGHYQIDGTTLFNWSYNLTNFGTSFSGNQLAEVRLLITVYQPEYWHNLAIQAGSQGSALCAGYSCAGLLP